MGHRDVSVTLLLSQLQQARRLLEEVTFSWISYFICVCNAVSRLKQLRVHIVPLQAKSEPPQLQRRRLLLRYWAAALDATGELVLHAGSLETVVATNAQTLDQAQLKDLLGEAQVTCSPAMQHDSRNFI